MVEVAVAGISALALIGAAYVGAISLRADRRMTRLETAETECRDALAVTQREVASLHARITILEPLRRSR